MSEYSAIILFQFIIQPFQNQQLTDVMKENQKLKKINAKLVNICKKRGKDSNRENEDPANQG